MLALMLALFYPPVPKEPMVDAPKGRPPQIIVAFVDKNGRLASQRTETRYLTVEKKVKKNVGGREVIEIVLETVPVTTRMEQRWTLDKATISEAGGKKLDKSSLAKRLTKPTVVVVSSDGKPIDAGYLKLFKIDTIVIVAPPEKEKMPSPFKEDKIPEPKPAPKEDKPLDPKPK